MIKVYLAGPMSGLVDFNYPAFQAAAAKLRAKGYHVENPAENAPSECGTWSGYMRNAIRQMLTCQMVAFLPQWQKSKGASEEFLLASKLNIPCYTVDDLVDQGTAAKPINPTNRLARAGCITLVGKEFSATDLINRVLINMHRPPKGKQEITRWAMVMHVTGLGSTAAHELCLLFGKNPDDVLR